MSQHTLQGRTEDELLWYRRRGFLQAAAAWTALGGWGAAMAQQRSNVVDLRGDAFVNGAQLRRDQYIQTGDRIETGPDGHLVFVMGNSSFLVRQNSRFVVERGDTLSAVSVLRLLTGAIVSVWSKGPSRQIVTPTLTAGIRGTGVYTEVREDGRSYFCNCYGTVELVAGRDRTVSRSDYHQSFWAEVAPRDGRLLTPAGAINHSDEEVELVAALLGQPTRWQELGRKGVKDGAGYMEENHPPHPLVR
ncbi:FecR domain-containing protein [Ramlibacter sp. USB13]|uniref:FecR domain-containing protein n=1 Tax=Ramlibacter cellulosilyticus TaxID=2764187 RepID=A0A923MUX7_9BURK|nr:FecR domain-containing protein [Ramlibacter cellulosilyticus]MBC5784207.1 FecR domain-containing protein [Ramlibacter cellulosilyticus]